jgi:DNA-binding NarL/FixJ family response regulator
MRVSVLVVDDDPGFRRLAARLLRSLGLSVVGEAESVEAGLDAAATLRPDAALVDIGLPDGDGCALALRLADMDGAPRVLLTSSDPDAVSSEDVRRVGAVGFIPKSDLPDGRLRRLLAGD